MPTRNTLSAPVQKEIAYALKQTYKTPYNYGQPETTYPFYIDFTYEDSIYSLGLALPKRGVLDADYKSAIKSNTRTPYVRLGAEMTFEIFAETPVEKIFVGSVSFELYFNVDKKTKKVISDIDVTDGFQKVAVNKLRKLSFYNDAVTIKNEIWSTGEFIADSIKMDELIKIQIKELKKEGFGI